MVSWLDKSKTSQILIIIYFTVTNPTTFLTGKQIVSVIPSLRATTVMEMLMAARLLDQIPFGLSPHFSHFQQKDGLI